MKTLQPFKNIQAVLFDMDGVVIDSYDLHNQAKKEALEFYNIYLADSEWKKIQDLTSTQIYRQIFNLFPEVKVSEKDFVARKSKIFAQRVSSKLLVSHCLKFAQQLKNKKIKTALVTANRRETWKSIAKKFRLNQYFDISLGKEDVKNEKPDPECYIMAAKLLGVEPKNCLVIEDSIPGIQSGKAAGCIVAGKVTADSKEVLLKAGADVVFENFSELLK
ncbi:MAG: HAD family phosphatase [Candidatus Moraniibacteriota bacterium]